LNKAKKPTVWRQYLKRIFSKPILVYLIFGSLVFFSAQFNTYAKEVSDGDEDSIPAIHLDSQGNISEEFWKYNPLIDSRGKSEPLSVVGDEKTWRLIQAVPPDYNIDPHDYNFTNAIDIVKQLRALKFPFWGDYKKPIKLNERFMVWEVNALEYQINNELTELYLIDLKPPVRVFYLTEIASNHIGFGVEKFSEEIYGFHLQDVNRNDGEAFLEGKFILIDFDSRTRKERGLGDLGQIYPNEKDKLLTVCGENTGYGFSWCWIYKWDGSKWINDSGNHPDFYKTYVLNTLQPSPKHKVMKRPTWEKVNAPILSAFIDAAKKGGPTAFVK